MRGGPRSLAIVAGVWLVTAAGFAHALVFGGGGSSKTDCLLVFDAPVNDPPTKPKKIRCTDGDPSCDGDGTVNGVCTFAVGVCANSTFDPLRCTPDEVSLITVDHAEDNGDAKFDVDFQALQTRIDTQILETPDVLDRCTTPTNVRVQLAGPFPGDVCKRAKKQIKITTIRFQGAQILRDTDKLKLTCDPPVPCDPTVLFPTGTYERIQRQIFNQSCALSGCHDSQSQQAELLLEPSGSYTNIVDVSPYTPAAAARGWRRIDAANAAPDTSFLYHKITGDLDDPLLGARMPFKRPKLDDFLVDIVRLWIEAGAPQTGWVPGTD